MKYRNRGITPNHTLSIHLTKKEKKIIEKLHNELNKKSEVYISVGELARRAIIAKIKTFDLKYKRLKKKEKKPYRISVTSTNKLKKDILLATQESKEKTISDFMRTAILEYYNLSSKDPQ